MFLSEVAEWKPDSLQTSKKKKTKAKEMEQTLKFLDGPETDRIQQKHP